MDTVGPVDQDFGQRAAFPLSQDGEDVPQGEAYVKRVRDEALGLPRIFRVGEIKEKKDQSIPPGKRARMRPTNTRDQAILCYEDGVQFSEVFALTTKLFGELGPLSSLDELYRKAVEVVRALPTVPVRCTSRAEWKDFVVHNAPVSLDHVHVFLLAQYITRWSCHRLTPRLVEWSWALLLRTPDVLTGDELSVLRDLFRQLDLCQTVMDTPELPDTAHDRIECGGGCDEEKGKDETRPQPLSREMSQVIEAIRFVLVNYYGQRDLDRS